MPLSHLANTLPITVISGVIMGSPNTPVSVKFPDGFGMELAAVPVAWFKWKTETMLPDRIDEV